MVQTGQSVQLATGQVLPECRVLLRLPLTVRRGADDRLSTYTVPRRAAALRLAVLSGA